MLNKFERFSSKFYPQLLSILRIMTAFLFMQHGSQKLFGVLVPAGKNAVELFSLMGVAGVLEFFGGLFILLGLLTRPVAFLLSGHMAFAYFMVHAHRGFWPILNQGELAVLFCFVFLFLAAAGGGCWSIDAIRNKHSKQS